MAKNLRMKDVMTPAPVTVQVDQTVEIARKLMADYECRHLPVLEDTTLIGIVSDRDVNLALSLDESSSDGLTLREIYVGNPYCVKLEDPLPRVLQDMVALHIGSALVIDNGKLVGIFTTMDACAVFSQYLLETYS